MILNEFSVSVVITCYNEGEKILNAVNSVHNQTYKKFEIILVNDSSNDSETNKICSMLAETQIRVYRTPENVGPSGARNYGIERANGDIIIPLDADDVLPPDAVKNILNAFQSNDSIGFVYGDYLQVELSTNTSTVIDCSVITNENLQISPEKVLYNWILLGMSPFTKELWYQLGGYSIEFSYTCQDVDLQMKSILNGFNSRYIQEVIYIWNKSNTGINSSEANLKSISKCYYNNFDYLLNYSANEDAFIIAMLYSDKHKIKLASKRMLDLRKKILLSTIFYYSPSFLVPPLAFVYNGIKKIKKIMKN